MNGTSGYVKKLSEKTTTKPNLFLREKIVWRNWRRLTGDVHVTNSTEVWKTKSCKILTDKARCHRKICKAPPGVVFNLYNYTIMVSSIIHK